MAARHVIIGGGPGGINAIETIRGYDADASITLISDEPAYARMALPYYISKNIPVDQVLTGDDGYFSKLGVTTQFGLRVTSVNASENTVTLDNGSTVEYDNLLIATGSSPQPLSIPGADGDGVHNLWTMEDAKNTVAAMDGDAAGVPHLVSSGAAIDARDFYGWTALHVAVFMGHEDRVFGSRAPGPVVFAPAKQRRYFGELGDVDQN